MLSVMQLPGTFNGATGTVTTDDERATMGDPSGVQLPDPAQPSGVSASIPDAGLVNGDLVATLAQTKYGAPVGWITPIGGDAEGKLWGTPWGTTVTGVAPDVFKTAPPDAVRVARGVLSNGPLVPQLPARKLDPGAPISTAASVPDAAAGAALTFAGLAQTKYGAPAGWFTPASTKAEGVMWVTPWGTVVSGPAPLVFQTPVGQGVTASDALEGGLAAAASRAAGVVRWQGNVPVLKTESAGATVSKQAQQLATVTIMAEPDQPAARINWGFVAIAAALAFLLLRGPTHASGV